MKLMTINLHALPPSWEESKLVAFADVIAKERPDVVALQELYQPMEVKGDPLTPILTALSERGACYHGLFRPVKVGYEQYWEGLGILSATPITALYFYPVSQTTDPYNWKKREILAVSAEGYPNELFCSLHLGRWDDPDEPFLQEWERTLNCLAPFEGKRIWLMGDFNNPAHRTGEGYARMIADGWQDCFLAACQREGDATVQGTIDGWAEDALPKRIDFIFCNRPTGIDCARVIFDGVHSPNVSDHFGVWAETCREESK